jgi:glyceraldehyde 3-phosphate dehydrogenase (phosphorylating)
MDSLRLGINGFGRIGRQVFKVLRDRYGSDVDVVAVNDLTDAATLAYLLRYDSVHGRFSGMVEQRDASLIVDGKAIALFAVREASKIPWSDCGVDVVLESTGRFTRGEAAAEHLEAGAQKVLISAPAKGDVDGTIVMGVNDEDFRPSWQVFSNASCTTNCAALMVKGVHDLLSIRHAAMTVIHAYTNDQSLHDQPHKELRRARAAAASLIPASTGSSTDIAKVLPGLQGKLSSVAIRTPNLDGSLVDLVCEVENAGDPQSINDAFRAMAVVRPDLVECTDDPIVSVDIVGNSRSVIIDTALTSVLDDHLVKVMGWFDNEWGYSNRCADLLASLKPLL